MLSRLVRPISSISQLGLANLALQQQTPLIAGNSVVLARCLFTTNQSLMAPVKEGPERDLVNFPRPKRAIQPGQVRFGFLPDEWFTAFYNKTGVTGGYAFGAGLLTYVLSKEIWVLEHEFWGGVSFFIMIIYAAKKFGPTLSAYLDGEQQKYIDNMNSGKINEIKSYNDGIAGEKKSQFQAEGMKLLFDVKRENVALQIEAAYRQRIMDVFNEVKKRLDYQVEKQNVLRSVEQKHMGNWIIASVLKSVAAESDAENLKKCIADLKGLAAKNPAI